MNLNLYNISPSATWPSLPKKHYNGLNQTKPNNISPKLM